MVGATHRQRKRDGACQRPARRMIRARATYAAAMPRHDLVLIGTLLVAAPGCPSSSPRVAETIPTASPAVAESAPPVATDPAPPAPCATVGSPLDQTGPFPASWTGVWRGPIVTASPKGTRRTFDMELHILPIAGASRYRWTIVYISENGRQERPYELVEIDRSRGHFQVDEKNGILIDSFLIGDSLHVQFAVQGSLITIRYLRRGTDILFELVTTQMNKPQKTGGVGKIPVVENYPLVVVQRAVLVRSE